MTSKSKTTFKPNVQQLFQASEEDGEISAASLKALTINADIGTQIQAGLGVTPDDVPASEVVLVSVMPDDSGSIRFAGNADLVREGHNIILDSLKISKQQDQILVHTRYLNGFVLTPYVLLKDAVRMDEDNYDPNLHTPLYDQTAVLLGTVLAKSREFEDAGVPVRTVTVVISDGADSGSLNQNVKTVKAIVEDMLKKENHVIAAMGIQDGMTDFRQIFRSMGIPDAWILTVKNTEKEIRKAFQMVSQSVLRVSQAAPCGGFIN